jgi:hypothetical protein
MKSGRLHAGYAYLMTAIVLLLLAAILLVSPTFGPGALDSEITFDTVFMNTVLDLDQAKWQWAEANTSQNTTFQRWRIWRLFWEIGQTAFVG